MKYISLLLLILIFSCTDKKTELSFYHWKTNFKLSNEQNNILHNLSVKKIYVKYFDVKLINSEATPVAEVRWKSIPSQNIIPVVYLTTSVFSSIDSTDILVLAKHVATKIKSLHPHKLFTEIQFDCDWTPSIKNKYFYFLKQINTLFNEVIISSTIRLYQYKYPKVAGVPPVDKGVLMYYNMGKLIDFKERNSILNNNIGKQYLGFNSYPLPIDIALPNFTWSLVFRDTKFEKISKDFTEYTFKNKGLFKHDTLNKYWILKDTVINNYYYRLGDNIRFESCSEDELLKAAKLLVTEINQTETTLIIYDLNSKTSQDYEKINTIFNAFK